MDLTFWLLIALCLGLVVSGILLLKQSAKKFNLTDEQKEKIRQRNLELEKQEAEEDN